MTVHLRRPGPLSSAIDDGGYQGTLVYVIGENGYQPDKYWYVKVGYGSCSGCDTLENIREYGDSAPTAEQIRRYMTLALHIVQGLREMGGTDALRADPDAAREFFRGAGILDADGRLAPPYVQAVE